MTSLPSSHALAPRQDSALQGRHNRHVAFTVKVSDDFEPAHCAEVPDQFEDLDLLASGLTLNQGIAAVRHHNREYLAAGLPEDRQAFDQLISDHRPEFITSANSTAELVHKILGLYRQVRDRLQTAGLPQVHLDDCNEQCDYLVYEGFIRDIPPHYLIRLPVYLQALLKRLDKTRQDSKQADRALPLIRALWREYLELEQAAAAAGDSLQQLRWMIEEFRISCFAQPMKTRGPVSENRIRKLIAEIKGDAI